MKKLLIEESSTSDLISIWKPRAFSIALISQTPDPVGIFLETKHIPKHEASVAAILIWNEAQKSRVKSNIPRLVICICILVFGMTLVLLGLFSSVPLAAIGACFVVPAAAVLLSEYLDRRR